LPYAGTGTSTLIQAASGRQIYVMPISDFGRFLSGARNCALPARGIAGSGEKSCRLVILFL
jgi:hypothetical protein